jgi:hypothetical protein
VRYLAATFLTTAALDWPILVLDRAGYAALGFAFLALALPAPPRRIRRARMPAVPPQVVELAEELQDRATNATARYTADGWEDEVA